VSGFVPFSSLFFVCAFFPCCIATYWLTPARFRNGTLLFFSVIFYAWGAPRFVPVVLALGVVDYLLALAIARTQSRWRVVLLALGITMHVGVLGYFKYANFAVAQINSLREVLSAPALHWTEVVLPIGVSFLTFEEMSYLIDVYRGDAPPARRWPHYLLFLMLFPHSIAGPIFRWKDLAAQFEKRKASLESVTDGLARFSFGLAKKVVIADSVAHIVDGVYGLPASEVTATYAWLGSVGYAIQIYFDFSGYSDMAIGLGAMFGFTFRENFREPYTARSVTEFWTRWHISLSAWLRDYLYIPLGGNRYGRARAELNALMVFAVSGIWHGAAWTFLLWGLYHGIVVALERRFERRMVRIPGVARALLTFALVVIGWVFFRATSVAQSVAMLRAMFFLTRATAEAQPLPAELFPRFSSLVYAGTSVYLLARMILSNRGEEALVRPVTWRRSAVSLLLLMVSIMHMTNTRYTPLIYFKF
jgi:alginate O-acetyltransferase complex protein AlgI